MKMLGEQLQRNIDLVEDFITKAGVKCTSILLERKRKFLCLKLY